MDKRSLRYGTVIVLIGAFAAFVIFRYAVLAASRESTRPASATEAERGPILDRNGRLLAVDSALYNVAIWRPETDNEAFPADSERLAAMLELPVAEILTKWRDGASDFFYLKRRIPPQIARAVQDAKASGGFSGVVVERVAGRLYPEKRLASHLIGFVGDGNRGRAGIESKYEEDLLPQASRGRTSAKAGMIDEQPRGNQVVLSVDGDMQFALEDLGRRAVAETGAEALILLAGDAKTGEILAYVSLPDFDPNEYFLSPSESWNDWPSVYAYEPGSVFKVFSMASALDLGGINRGTTFECDGSYHKIAPSGEPISIKCLGSHGTVTIETILEFSCNSGAGYAADTVQSLDLYDRLMSFGFGNRTGIALPGESPGALSAPDTWSLRSKPTIAMGQEILVTAVQMLSAAGAIANGGILLKPIAVRRVLSPDGNLVYENAPQAVRRVVSAETARTILGAMEAASGQTGTGHRAKVRDVPMAVKTGTAQVIDPTTRRYSDTDYIASTLAIFPADDPRIVLYLAIIKPRGESYLGGRIAAPVIREAAEIVLGLSDLPRELSPRVEHSGAITLPRLAPAVIGERMPDLLGTPKRLLLPLLERRDIIVRIEGEGYVVSQKPEAGERVPAGTTVLLELR